ncbi:hypothetical protein EHQ59_05650 [Leptospira kemamanensis]|uniref:Lipoprotein n=1 Tax=Leptospira kemamanensis TaxID=2484942 RepID=A0A4R9JSN0_9LEPT|nr:hypothetical protein EHQ59_05650 [Leptospira kemamanensis]
MKNRISISFFFVFLFLVSCSFLENKKSEGHLVSQKPNSYSFQYQSELTHQFLKVGPSLQISIGQFAVQSFSSLVAETFANQSLTEKQTKDPLEPNSIVLNRIQVNRTVVFEEGTTKFKYATFSSIVEFLLVKPSGETVRILGHSLPIEIHQIPFSPEDGESEGKIAGSLHSALEEGLNQIFTLQAKGNENESRNMFQR